MFKNEINAEKFFKYLNFKHPNIKFTMEKENNKFLPFLAVLVKNEGRTFTTSVYRKNRLLDFLRNIAVLHLSATKSVL